MHYTEANALSDTIAAQISSERRVRVLPVAAGQYAVYVEDPHGLYIYQEFHNLATFLYAEREDTWVEQGIKI